MPIYVGRVMNAWEFISFFLQFGWVHVFFIPTFCFYDTESLQKDHDSWQCTSKLNVSHEKIRYFRQTIYSESMQMVWNFFGEVNNILFTKQFNILEFAEKIEIEKFWIETF